MKPLSIAALATLLSLAIHVPSATSSTLLGTYKCHDYYLSSSSSVSGARAEAAALRASLGRPAFLATINSASEEAWVRSQLGNPNEPLWIGLSDEITEGRFVWDDGEPLGYTHWVFAEPTNNGYCSSGGYYCACEDHVLLNGHPNQGGGWNDVAGDCWSYRGLIEVGETPAPGSAGVAYVIVGNVSVPPDFPWVRDLVMQWEDQAASLAEERFARQGYTVLRRGYAVGQNYATTEDLLQAARDPNAKAMWISAHGNSDEEAATWPQEYRSVLMQNDIVLMKDIRQARQKSGSTLRELSLFSCHVGLNLDLSAFWGIDNNTRVYAPKSFVTALNNLWEERPRVCDQLPQAPGLANAPILPEGTQPFIVPLHMVNSAGVYGDALYGTLAGARVTSTSDASGNAQFDDSGVGIHAVLQGLPAASAVEIWTNRYTTMPADTVPPGSVTIAGFALDCSVHPSHATLTFDYDPNLSVDPTAIRVWRFEETTRGLPMLPVSVDIANHRVRIDTNSLGRFMLGWVDSPLPTAIAAFDAHVKGNVIVLRAAFRSDLPIDAVHVYRAIDDGVLSLLTTTGKVADDRFQYVDEQVKTGVRYRYQVGAVNREGEFLSPVVAASLPVLRTTLEQNHPNPFNPQTAIHFTLEARERVALTIYNGAGQRVRSLVDEVRNAGPNVVVWNGRDDHGSTVPSGVYFYKMQAGKFKDSKRMVLLK